MFDFLCMLCGPVEAAINFVYSSDPDTRFWLVLKMLVSAATHQTNYAVSGSALSLNIQSVGALFLLFCSVRSMQYAPWYRKSMSRLLHGMDA